MPANVPEAVNSDLGITAAARNGAVEADPELRRRVKRFLECMLNEGVCQFSEVVKKFADRFGADRTRRLGPVLESVWREFRAQRHEAGLDQVTPVDVLLDAKAEAVAGWSHDAAQKALDELFSATAQYRSSEGYLSLVRFVSRFRFYSPYNALLIHIQMPGATFVAPPSRWMKKYGRRIKPGARPLIILQPMGPVMFVFDASDTDGEPLPREVVNPFEVRAGPITDELEQTIENAKRDGVQIHTRKLGSQAGGSIQLADRKNRHSLVFGNAAIPVRYELELNENVSRESQYATLAHELGHLYCGHLGTPDERWWPSRHNLSTNVCEFEAESVAYLVCTRLGLSTHSDEYLSGYAKDYAKVPNISLEAIMKAAGLIESMGRGRLKARKDQEAP